jgi:hypothetical protein
MCSVLRTGRAPIGSSGAARDTGRVPEVVDPMPVIEAKLSALAAEYEPKLDALERAVAEADAGAKRSAKAELRAMKRKYAAARREVEKLRGPIGNW